MAWRGGRFAGQTPRRLGGARGQAVRVGRSGHERRDNHASLTTAFLDSHDQVGTICARQHVAAGLKDPWGRLVNLVLRVDRLWRLRVLVGRLRGAEPHSRPSLAR
jgi:hypothetical protein